MKGKIMKKILSILGAIGLTATGVSPVLAMSPAHNTHNNQEQDLINYQKELVNAMDTIIQNDNELFIKNIIDSSLSFNSKDGKIIVDKNLISKINNEQIVNLLSDAKFEILLNKMLDDNQLIITTEGKTEFKLEENNAFTAGL
jgi:archaellum component FlaG (FlaF/FlaG flagellin family)